MPLLGKTKRGIFFSRYSVFLHSVFSKKRLFSKTRLKIPPLLKTKNASLGKNTTEKTPLLRPDPLFNITISKEAFFKRGIFPQKRHFQKRHFFFKRGSLTCANLWLTLRLNWSLVCARAVARTSVSDLGFRSKFPPLAAPPPKISPLRHFSN